MKKKINFCLLLFLFCSINSFAQTSKSNTTPHLSKAQKVKDSIEFAKFKENHPEDFLHKRLAMKLIDGSYVVEGYTTLIEIKDNHLTDSVYHNFIPGMPDTSTITPFNDIKISDSKVKIEIFPLFPLLNGKNMDSAEITPEEPDLIVNNKIGKLPISNFDLNSRAIKLSVNGKIVFDWKPVENFVKQVSKFSEKSIGLNFRMFGYTYGYIICDTNVNLNDQLLIEIKNTNNNWMIDRYNITRVAASPKVVAIIPSVNQQIPTLKNDIFIAQKKTSRLNRLIEN